MGFATTAAVISGVSSAATAASSFMGKKGKRPGPPPGPSPEQLRLSAEMADIGRTERAYGLSEAARYGPYAQEFTDYGRQLYQQGQDLYADQMDRYRRSFAPLEERYAGMVSGLDYLTPEEIGAQNVQARGTYERDTAAWRTSQLRDLEQWGQSQVDVTPRGQGQGTSYKGVYLPGDVNPESAKAAIDRLDAAHQQKYRMSLFDSRVNPADRDREIQGIIENTRRPAQDPILKTQREVNPQEYERRLAEIESGVGTRMGEFDARIGEQTRLQGVQRLARERELAEVKTATEEAAERYRTASAEDAASYMRLAEEQAQRAATETQTAGDIQSRAQERELQRMGVNPASMRSAALSTSAGLETARQKVGTMNVIRSKAQPLAENIRQQGRAAAQSWRDYAVQFKIGQRDRELARVGGAIEFGRDFPRIGIAGGQFGLQGAGFGAEQAYRGFELPSRLRSQGLPWYQQGMYGLQSAQEQRQQQYGSQLSAYEGEQERRGQRLSAGLSGLGTLAGYYAGRPMGQPKSPDWQFNYGGTRSY